ncbi:MAG: amidohydrolase family protein [Ferrimicrobium sp.]
MTSTLDTKKGVPSGRLILRGGRLADGARCDIAIDQTTGYIDAVGDLLAHPNDTTESCEDMVILPAPAEPHAHLDKALLSTRSDVPINHNGDLAGAISIMASVAFDPRDTEARARAAVLELVRHGVTTVRTHVDVRRPMGVHALEVIVRLANEFRADGIADIQTACLLGSQLTGSPGRENRRLLSLALEMGVDIVGGCPYLDPNPLEATELLLSAAQEARVPCDLHTDETLDPSVLTVVDLIKVVERTGFDLGVSASHCVSLGVQPEQVQRAIATQLEELNISVITLPQTNLSLQSRGVTHSPPRALAPISLLAAAGVNVAAGADNVQDPFCPLGRFDPVETVSLLTLVAHRSPEHAWKHCSTNARRAMGKQEVRIAPGFPAELLAIRGATLIDAIASSSEERIVVHRGRIVSRTQVASEIIRPHA